MGSNNFLQFNEEKNNMMNDGDFAASSQRKEGFVRGKAATILINKMMYQFSTFLTAFGEALKAKDYNISDASLTTLITELGNLITQKDLDDNYLNSSQTQTAVDAAVAGISVPAGAVFGMATNIVPDGYLKCNGAAVSRTTYSVLFGRIGTAHGVGNGSTTFNLPDYRGMFLRGWNNSRSDSFKDPDVAGRSAGDSVGSTQIGGVESHRHSTTITYKTGLEGGQPQGSGNVSGASKVHAHLSDLTGGNETRPNNIYVMYVIKF